MAIANKAEAQAFLSQFTLDDDGLPTANTPSAALQDYQAACQIVGKAFDFFGSFLPKRDAAIAAASAAAANKAAGPVSLRIGRSGESLGFYRGKKHAKSFGPDVFRLFTQNAKLLSDFGSTDQRMYWQAMPAYESRGKLQKAREAVVLEVKANTWQPVVLATGTEAAKLAGELGLAPINEVNESDD